MAIGLRYTQIGLYYRKISSLIVHRPTPYRRILYRIPILYGLHLYMQVYRSIYMYVVCMHAPVYEDTYNSAC